jgi:hypothetical protein
MIRTTATATATATARARARASALVVLTVIATVLGVIGAVVALATLPARAATAPESLAQDSSQDLSQDSAQASLDRLPVTVLIDAVTPLAPKPDDTVTVRGWLVNVGDQPLGRIRAHLRVGTTPLSRSDIAEYASGEKTSPSGLVAPAETADRIVADELAGRARASFALTVPVARLTLREPGAYVLSVEVIATYPDGRRDRAGLEQTFLPWLPDPVKATRVALLWPLVDSPKRDAEGVFRDDALAKALRPEGAIGGLVGAAAGRQVTWAVDPDLIETTADMADGYQVRSGAELRPGTGQQAAREWLDNLRDALRISDAVTLGYADPDATALQHNGLDKDLIAATSLGKRVAEERLKQAVTGDVAWPVGGFADPATLETLRTAGTSAVVINSRQVPTTAAFTPSGRATVRALGGTLDGLVLDAGLSDALAGRINSPGAAALAVQRFLADTAVITAQRPSDARTLLVAPPRRWRPTPQVAARLASSFEQVPWVSLTPLSELRATPVPNVRRQQEGYPRAAARAELTGGYLREVSRLRRDLLNFGAILTEPTSATDAYDRAILRTESSAWRGNRQEAIALRRTVRSQLDKVRSAVHVIVSPNATLASSTGILPVTVANGLDQPVRLGLALTSDNSARLTVAPPARIAVPAETNQQVTVPVQAVANGVTVVRVQLTTPDGDPYGQAVPVRVNATSIGTIGMIVTGGALAVLFLAASIRVVRRLRADGAARELPRKRPR